MRPPTILALGYWAVLMFVAPPGGVAGDLTAEGNLGAWIDRALMEGHLWKPRWDPEGLLSTVPAIATTLLGTLAGLCLGTEWTPERKAGALMTGGALAALIGLGWSLTFPLEQGAVDQFLRGVHCRLCVGAPGRAATGRSTSRAGAAGRSRW